MALYYLAVAIVLSVINIGILQYLHSRKIASVYSTLFYVITIGLSGHFYLAISSNIEEALLANKIAYIAAAFAPLYIFLGVLDFCRIRIKTWVMQLLLLLSLGVYVLAATAGFSPIFYESATLVKNVGGVTDFKPVFGWAHVFFNIELLGYIIAIAIACLYASFCKKNISYKNLGYLVIVGILGTLSFVISRNMGLDMLAMPTVFLLAEWTWLLIINNIRKYDIDSMVLYMQDRQNVNAYISFTDERKYITCNARALKLVPEILNMRVDQKLPSNTEFGKAAHEILDVAVFGQTSKIIYKQVGNRHFRCCVSHLTSKRGDNCYIIQFDDDTNTQNYIKELCLHNEKLKEENSHINEMRDQMIAGLINMLENRDLNTGAHSHRAGHLCCILIADLRKNPEYHLDESFCKAVVRAAPMHDLGKIAIDDVILRKPGKYTLEEFEIMKTHPEKGAVIVEHLLKDLHEPDQVMVAKNITLYHHERYDGTGYPAHLKGESIPLEARLMAIADVYDALVSKRCYKEKMSFESAYNIIIESMGTHFDPKLRQTFENCRREFEDYYKNAEAAEN